MAQIWTCCDARADLKTTALEIDETYSEGAVTLRSSDPNDPPVIESRLLSDRRDLDRMLWGMDHALAAFGAIAEGLDAELLIPDAAIASDPEWLHEHIQQLHSTGYHPSCTCRIGHVVDERCRLNGARGLWLADASVMPAEPRANTNLPTLMIGERVADFLKSEI